MLSLPCFRFFLTFLTSFTACHREHSKVVVTACPVYGLVTYSKRLVDSFVENITVVNSLSIVKRVPYTDSSCTVRVDLCLAKI